MNKLKLSFVSIYKAAFKNSGFTVMCSGIISLCIILLYALFALVYDSIDIQFSLSTVELLIALIILSVLTGLILPFVYSFFACYHVLNSPDKDKVKIKSFFKTSLIGISRPIRAAISNLKTIISSFLIYMTIIFLGFMIVSIYATNSTGELHNMYVELSAINLNSPESIYAIDSIIANYEEALRLPTLLIEYFSLIFSIYFYIHTIARNTMKYFFALAINPEGKPQAIAATNFFFKKGMKGHNLEYHGYFYKIMWPTTVIYFAGFSLIYFLTSIYMNLDLFIASLTGLVVPLVILTLFLPVLFEFHDQLLPRYERYFFEYANKDLKMRVNQFADKENLSPEDQKFNEDVKKQVEELNDLVDELKKMEEENKEEDDKKED